MSDGSDKVDFRKALPELYNPKNRHWQFVDVPELSYLMIDGAGDPNTSPQYAASVATLYSVAYPFAAKKNPDLRCDALRLERLAEGLCVQLLHVGSYDDEAPKLHQLHHELMPTDGIAFNGHHHEIYLSDPRKVSADRLRTILRQPVRSIGCESLVRAAAP